jgi:hypothetical protein
MPYLFTTEVRFEDGKYILHRSDDLVQNFPFVENNVLVGKFVSTQREGKTIRVNQEFRCKLRRRGNYVVGEILEPNPLKAAGLPLPSTLLAIAYKYVKQEREKPAEYPIAENIVLKGSVYSFEDEANRILKEEEAGIILEGTIFHPQLRKHVSTMKEALLSFGQENFAYTKTSCRKILEDLRRVANKWSAIDNSKSLCEKFNALLNSLYSFASIGGPHEGITTREETELLLKATTSVVFYVNILLKSGRVY